jgi:hypothetical protein
VLKLISDGILEFLRRTDEPTQGIVAGNIAMELI